VNTTLSSPEKSAALWRTRTGQTALGGRDFPRSAWIDGDAGAKRAGKPLEARLGDVMIVLAVERLDVQGDAGVHRESLEELAHELRVELANLRRMECRPEDEERAAGDVERDARQRLVHGQERLRVAGDALEIAQRLAYGLPQRDAGVFNGMVLIYMQIALRGDLQIDETVPRDLIEHVIEEADSGRNIGFTGPVEVHLDADIGFLGLSLYRGASHLARSPRNIGEPLSKSVPAFPPLQ
jgi:hypothetical protein